MEYKLVKISAIETPHQGSLASAKIRKDIVYKAIKITRNRLNTEPLNGNRMSLRLTLLDLTGKHQEAMRHIQESKNNIEKRANELGLTIIKPKRSN